MGYDPIARRKQELGSRDGHALGNNSRRRPPATNPTKQNPSRIDIQHKAAGSGLPLCTLTSPGLIERPFPAGASSPWNSEARDRHAKRGGGDFPERVSAPLYTCVQSFRSFDTLHSVTRDTARSFGPFLRSCRQQPGEIRAWAGGPHVGQR